MSHLRAAPGTRWLALGLIALPLAAILAWACSTPITNTTQTDFFGPSGLAVAPARDRDLLFIASTGGGDLRAISICNTPSPTDGGSAQTTCTDTEDFHFLPGPIRVFAGSFPVGNRPVRLAPISLRDSAGSVEGAVLVAGVAALVDSDGGILDGGDADAGTAVALPALKLVDSVNLLDATREPVDAGVPRIPLKEPANIPLDAPPIDVVSLQLLTGVVPASGAPTPAFVLTQANEASGVPAEITALSVAPTANGPLATVVGRCSLDILATRLALIPGQADLLYVADGSPDSVPGGRGDGALELETASIPPLSASVPACTIHRRLVATDPVTGVARGLASMALSPAYFTSDGRTYPAGAQLLGVTVDGLLVFIRTDLGVPSPVPPFTPLSDGGTVVGFGTNGVAYVEPDGGVAQLLPDGGLDAPFPNITAAPMEPLRVNGLAREVSYLQTPLTCPAGQIPGTPCELIRVGGTTQSFLSVDFALVAIVTSTDGSVLFIDADDRRFISDTRDSQQGSQGVQPSVNATYQFAPAQPNGQVAPTLTFAPADATVAAHVNVGWVNAGVSRQASWRAIWHAELPGLELRGGTLTREGAGQLRFTMPGIDLSRWTNPTLAAPLDVGDVLSFNLYSQPDPSQALCSALANENYTPLGREFSITAIGTDYVLLAPSQAAGSDGGAGFDPPDSCLPVGATAQFRTGKGVGDEPFMVLEGNEVRGRAAITPTGAPTRMFIGHEDRFDYPLQYIFNPAQPQSLPTADSDIGVAFALSGVEPVTPQSTFSFQVASGQSPTRVSDTGAGGGFAGPIITYTSLKIPGNLVFAAGTGSNSLLQIDPSLIGVLNGVIAYR